MIDLQTAVTRESVDALGSVIERLQAETGRSTEDSVTYAAMFVARSGGASSKIGKKNRESVNNPIWAQAKWAIARKKRGYKLSPQDQALLQGDRPLSPFLIVRRRQGGHKPILIPSYVKKDPRREIERRGLAKKTWGVMYGKLGAMRQGGGSSGGKDFRVSKYREKWGDTAGSIAVRMLNKLSYLEDAYPGIAQTAINKGSSAIGKYLDGRIARAVAKANR